MKSSSSSGFVTSPAEIPATGTFNRYARVHQRQRGAADASLRGRAIGHQDLGNKAKCIRGTPPPKESPARAPAPPVRRVRFPAVPDLWRCAPLRRCRMENYSGACSVLFLRCRCRQHLDIGHGTERCHRQNLRLTSAEQPRAVRSRQKTYLCAERADLFPGLSRPRARCSFSR